jgi:hypothetical protein
LSWARLFLVAGHSLHKRDRSGFVAFFTKETQGVVMRYVQDVYRTLTRRGIPIEILREEQMPIHVTPVGTHHGEGEETAPENDIRP